MATTTKGLKGFKPTGNPLLDALVIMSLVPGTGGMAADEEIGKDLGAFFNKIKPFKEGEGKAIGGAKETIPQGAEKANMIKEFMAKQKEAPAQPSPPTPAGAQPALEQLASPSPAKAVRAPKTAGGKPGPMQMSQVNQRFVNSITEAQRQDILGPMEKTKQIYQYLKGKLPDTPKRAYGWDLKIKQIEDDEAKYLKPDFFAQLTTDPTPQSNKFINDLRARYEKALEDANKTLQGLTRKP